MKSFEFHPDAESELVETALHYEAEVPGLGADFEAEVRRAVGLLQEHPELGSYVTGSIRHLVLRRFKHSVIYVVRPYGLLILAIAHGSRRPKYWIQRADC